MPTKKLLCSLHQQDDAIRENKKGATHFVQI
jgi:hypothetical protein